MNRILIAAFAALPFVFWATMPDAAPDEPLSYEADLEGLVVKRCAGCHSTKDPKAKLILEEGAGYGQLVGRASVQVPEAQIVVPGEPAASYLWHKLNFTADVGKGMPRTLFGAKRLPEKEIEFFRRWIEDGARK